MAMALFFEEETHEAVNVTKSHVLRPLLICSLPGIAIFQGTDPTGSDDFSLHPNQFNITELLKKLNKSEVWWKIWNCWKWTPLWKILIIISLLGCRIQETPPLPIWHEADREDLLFLDKGVQSIPRISCLSLSWMIQVLSLAHESVPLLCGMAFLETFLEK